MSQTIEICPTCFRTDAFTPGEINHDKDWHEYKNYKLVKKTGVYESSTHINKPYKRKVSWYVKRAKKPRIFAFINL